MATSTANSFELANADLSKLKARFDELRLGEVLEIDGKFTVRDIDRDIDGTKKVIRGLRHANAIEDEGYKLVDNKNSTGKSRLKQYRWAREVASYLRQHKEERSELPCGCHAHVHHDDDGGFGCRYCTDDPEFDREDVEEAVFS